jgi:TetR/AcrR family transcriptional regulator, transcriptional repressor for nem operon
MRRSREDAAETRRAAVEAAARLYRARGLEGVSIGDVMAEVGMTVGGFYRHFESREALVAEACARAFAESSQGHAAAVDARGRAQPIEVLLARYLSAAHRDAPAAGCPLPALVSELSHQAPPVRRTFTEGVRDMLHGIERATPGAGAEARLALLASLVGAVALARAVDDPALRDRLLSDTRGYWKRRLTKPRRRRRPAKRSA